MAVVVMINVSVAKEVLLQHCWFWVFVEEQQEQGYPRHDDLLAPQKTFH
jgi:hypothetical protein